MSSKRNLLGIIISVSWVSLLCLVPILGCNMKSYVTEDRTNDLSITTSPIVMNVPRITRETTLVPIPTLTATTQNEDLFQSLGKCDQFQLTVPQNINSKNGLILYDPNMNSANGILLMDLSTGALTELEKRDYFVSSLNISPNGKWIAYRAGNILVLKNIATNITVDIPWKSDWTYANLRGWVNDDLLLFSDDSSPELSHKLIAFNPFEKKEIILKVEYPDQYTLYPMNDASWPYYDSTLNYVVYSAMINNMIGFSLYDRRTNNQIVFTPVTALINVGAPLWSHDGEKYFFVSKKSDTNDIFGTYFNIGMLDGSIKQLARIPQEKESLLIVDKSWSPNDEFVGVTIQDSSGTNNFVIIDLENEQVIYTCLQVEYLSSEQVLPSPNYPTWSLDSQQVIIERSLGGDKGQILLLDLPTLKYSILMEDVRVLGWVSLEP